MKVQAAPAWELFVWEFLTRQRYGPVTAQTMPGHDEPAELCEACGQPVGSGTLLDQYPSPPRMYVAETSWSGRVTPELRARWRAFAGRYCCLRCRTLAGVTRLVPGGWA